LHFFSLADAAIVVVMARVCVGFWQADFTALHHAAFYGNLSVCTALLEKGANVNSKSHVRCHASQ
jgi:hypothetical protein